MGVEMDVKLGARTGKGKKEKKMDRQSEHKIVAGDFWSWVDMPKGGPGGPIRYQRPMAGSLVRLVLA